MAFQDVATPRFYVNYLEWILNNYRTGTPTLVYSDLDGNETEEENANLIKHTGLSNRSALKITPPNNSISATIKYTIEDGSLNTSNPILQKVNFSYCFGSNLPSFKVRILSEDSDGGISTNSFKGTESFDGHSYVANTGIFPAYDGYSIAGLGDGSFIQHEDEKVKEIQIRIGVTSIWYPFDGTESFELSSFGFGRYFDMMHSPELALTYSKSYDGVQKQKSMGGATLVNYNYLRPPAFGSVGYFELSNADNPLNIPTRTGRRNYQLNFKYLENSTTKDSLFPQSENLHRFDDTTTFTKNDTLYDDNSFYGDVIHMTQGGTIPFIFQADNDNFSGDQFSVCTFDQKDFNFKQVAPSVYDCSLKIVESW